MKRNKILSSGAIFVMGALFFSACSTDFLEDKKDYGNVVDVYEDYQTASAVVDGIYTYALTKSDGTIGYASSSAGASDVYLQCTEEYSGLSDFVDPTAIITTANPGDMPNIFYNERKTANNLYGWILTCNDVLEGVEVSAGLSTEEKNKLMGQAYFFRAWVYYRLVKEFGGVPLVKTVENPISSEVEALTVPRSTTKECIDFICEDLRLASTLLPSVWTGADYGRVTSGAALAMQGRARLLYASPVFNRADDLARWNLAYESNKAALAELALGGYGLSGAGTPGVNASAWGKMFSEFNSSEAVFVTLYNNVNEGTNTNPQKWNSWENSIRPLNALGGGGKNATDLMVDLFPMMDGKKPGESEYTYSKEMFMLDRDPRFYRTFAFPGVYWSFNGDPTSLGTASYPFKGTAYALWNYSWYANAADRADETKSGFSGGGLGTEYKGVYIRKRSDDYSINNAPLYVYRLTAKEGFKQSAAPYMEIRYAEVLLNFAEAACGAGQLGEALEALKQVRMRVGYTDDCGLSADLASDRGKMFGAILYERQIELAYEGKRFDDMRRWMLWDGGEGQAALHASWALTGFGGNTCTYLGVEPFNGKRRDNLELCVATNGGVISAGASATDPYEATRPTPCDLSKELLSANTALVNFYSTSLVRKTRRGDEVNKVVTFKPQCYLMGLKSNAQVNNPTLEQTIGWDDYITGGVGTFDPLAE